jgi:hypothetical protein
MLVGLWMQAWHKRYVSRVVCRVSRDPDSRHSSLVTRHSLGLWAAFALILLANVVLLGLVQKHRLRDSMIRRAVLETVQAAVPTPEPGAMIYVVGVPFHVRDVSLGIPLLYDVPVEGKCLEPGEPTPPSPPFAKGGEEGIGTAKAREKGKQYVVRFQDR